MNVSGEEDMNDPKKPTANQIAFLRIALGYSEDGVFMFVRARLKSETGIVKDRKNLTAHDFGRAIGYVKEKRAAGKKRKRNRP